MHLHCPANALLKFVLHDVWTSQIFSSWVHPGRLGTPPRDLCQTHQDSGESIILTGSLSIPKLLSNIRIGLRVSYNDISGRQKGDIKAPTLGRSNVQIQLFVTLQRQLPNQASMSLRITRIRYPREVEDEAILLRAPRLKKWPDMQESSLWCAVFRVSKLYTFYPVFYPLVEAWFAHLPDRDPE